MPYKNKEDRDRYYKKWEANNKDKRRKYNKKLKQRNKKFSNKVVFKFGCRICGYKKCARALHFHHVDPKTKIKDIADLVGDTMSLNKIKEEMRKCIILCANCHAEIEDKK